MQRPLLESTRCWYRNRHLGHVCHPLYPLPCAQPTDRLNSDFADEYQSAEVIGTDISAVQPGWVPANLRFQIDDAQLDWTFEEDEFDFIHVRYLYGAIDDWDKLYTQAFRYTKPGGWFEHVEIDLETRSENPNNPEYAAKIFQTWCSLFFAAGDKTGRTFKIARDGQMEKLMADKGFVDVCTKTYKVPIGGWARDKKLKQVGFYSGVFVDQSLDGFAIYPVGEVMGWTQDEVTALVSHARKSLRDPRTLPYYHM